jgi:8-oxo-dGTP pyrophosphatase MutT (NUDIX family)
MDDSKLMNPSSLTNTTLALVAVVLAMINLTLYLIEKIMHKEVLVKHVPISYKPGRKYSRRASMAIPSGKVSVVGLIMTPQGMLLAARGPESRPAELIGKLGGIGGKVDVSDATLEAALQREVMEEISVDISDAELIPVGVQSSSDGATAVLVMLVYLENEVTPIVPPSEAQKVVNPEFHPINRIPYGDMIPELAACLTANSAILRLHGARTGSAAAPSEWLQRAMTRLPDGYGVFLVNNKDALCTAYALSAQFKNTDTPFDFEKLGAEVPEQGYSPYDLLPQKDWNDLSIWDMDNAKWIEGDGKTRFLMAYSRNGSDAHYDGLFKLGKGQVVRDFVVYPQGRSSLVTGLKHMPPTKAPGTAGPDLCEFCLEYPGKCSCAKDAIEAIGDDDSNVTDIEDKSSDGSSDISDDVSDVSDLTVKSGMIRDGRINFRGFQSLKDHFKAKVGLKLGKGKVVARNAFPSDPLSDSYYTGGFTIVHGSAYRASNVITWQVKDDIYYNVENLSGNTTKASPTVGRALQLLNAFSFASTLRFYPLNLSVRNTMSVTMEFLGGLGKSSHGLYSFFDLTLGRSGRNTYTLVENARPNEIRTRSDENSKNIASVFGRTMRINAPNSVTPLEIAQEINRFSVTTDDVSSEGLLLIYERLVAGWFAARVGAKSANLFNGYLGNADTADLYDSLFPQPEKLAWIWGFTSISRGVQATVSPFARYRPVNGMTGMSLFASATSIQPRYPQIQPNVHKDWRAALLACTAPSLGFKANNTVLRPTDVNYSEDNEWAVLQSHGDSIPAIFFMFSVTDTNMRTGNIPPTVRDFRTTIENPDSWRDAIRFMLTHFGGSGAFEQAMLHTVPNCTRFRSPKLNDLPTPMETKFFFNDNNVRLLNALWTRLIVMRFVRASPEFGNLATSNKMRQVQRLLTAITIRGSTNLGAGLNELFGANIPAYTPDLADARLNSIEFDAEFFQLFADVNIGNTTFAIERKELEKFTGGLTTGEQSSILMWLQNDDFLSRWFMAATAYQPGFGDRIQHVTNDSSITPITENNYWHAIIGGHYENRLYNLPVFCHTRVRVVRAWNGIGHLRSIAAGVSIWHKDQAALDICDLIQDMPGEEFVKRLLGIAAQWRTCTDIAVEATTFTHQNVMRAFGQVVTGNVDLDTQLRTQNDRVPGRTLSELMSDYLRSLSASMQDLGYSVSPLTEYATATPRFSFINTDMFGYEYNGNINFDNSSLLLYAINPIVAGFLNETGGRVGGIAKRVIDLMASRVTGDTTPWDSWMVKAASFIASEPMSVLRTICIQFGWHVSLKAVIYWKARSTPLLPTQFSVLKTVTSRPARRSDSVPYSFAYAVDPINVYRPVLGYSITTNVVGGITKFLKPWFTYVYLANPRITARAPRSTMAAATIAPTVPISATCPVRGYNANANMSTGVFGGMVATTGFGYLQPDGTINERFTRERNYFGTQASGNWNYSRAILPQLATLGRQADVPRASYIASMCLKPAGISATITDYDFCMGMFNNARAQYASWVENFTIIMLPIHFGTKTAIVDPMIDKNNNDGYTSSYLGLNNAAIWGRTGMNEGSGGDIIVPGVEPEVTKNLAWDLPAIEQPQQMFDHRHMVRTGLSSEYKPFIASIRAKSAETDKVSKRITQLEKDLKAAQVKFDKMAKLDETKDKKATKAKKTKKGKKAVAPSDSVSVTTDNTMTTVSTTKSQEARAARMAQLMKEYDAELKDQEGSVLNAKSAVGRKSVLTGRGFRGRVHH